MTLESIRESMKEYARDIKLNLSSVLTEEGAPGLTRQQILGIALACSYQTKNRELAAGIFDIARDALTAEQVEAAKGAATVMALNNVYYRSVHLMEDPELGKMPARLRMSIIAKHGISKTDFELYCLAVSAMAGCGSCLNSHAAVVKQAGISNEGVQSSLRIAATINAAAQALFID
jgi:alkyl hydroperoxide reductase subunit D